MIIPKALLVTATLLLLGQVVHGIVGGTDVDSAPEWFVMDLNQLCAGSLVSANTVVSAGHCYNDCSNTCEDPDCNEPCPTQVRIGSTSLSGGGIVRDVVPNSCTVHPNFETDPNRYDVATYKLTEPVILSQYAQIQANLAFPGIEQAGENDVVDAFTVFGHGRTSNDASDGSDKLQQLSLTYWHNCEQYVGGEDYDATHHICAYSSSDAGVCFGDSGAPLVYEDFLVGIVSFLGRDEEPFCAQNNVDTFSRISTYWEWILVSKFTLLNLALTRFSI